MSNKGKEAEIHYEGFLERLDALYKEFGVSCTDVNGRVVFLYKYDGNKLIHTPASTGKLCDKCLHIFNPYPDKDVCPECWNKRMAGNR